IEYSDLLTRYGQKVGDTLEAAGHSLRIGKAPLPSHEFKSGHLRLVELARLARYGKSVESGAYPAACPSKDAPLLALPETAELDRRFHADLSDCLTRLCPGETVGASGPEPTDSDPLTEVENTLFALFEKVDTTVVPS
ncbi:MAG: hypothetical protein HQM02_11155, partial [Magnetococcales bacterium]|nr:hypothetical protein [Magnetococcales bacterium]